MDRIFDAYSGLVPQMQEFFKATTPKDPSDSDFAYRTAIKARALDAIRGMLPASSLSNLGIYGTGQAYEALLLRMRSHPLPESRAYADLMLDGAAQGRAVVPQARRPARPGWPDERLPGRRQRLDGRRRRQPLRRRDRGSGRRRRRRARRLRSRRRDQDRRGDALPPHVALRGARSRPGCGRCRSRTVSTSSGPTSAIARTAVNDRAGRSSAPTTASTSCPTTAPSAISSAIGC